MCVWQLFVPGWLELITRYVLAGGATVLVFGVLASLFVVKGDVPAGKLAGVWAEPPVGGNL